MNSSPRTGPFLDEEQVRNIRGRFGTPVFVYDQKALESQARAALEFPNAFGLTVRYAMKACPNAGVIGVLNRAGLQIDASSGWEVRRALEAGVEPQQILLTAQQLPDDFEDLVSMGVRFNACSLHQARLFREPLPRRETRGALQPGTRFGQQQPHQRRRPFRQFRHLARTPRPGRGPAARPPPAH